MPTWGQMLTELQKPENLQPNGVPNFDKVRRQHLAALANYTGRATVVYATAFLDQPDAPSPPQQIQLGDLQGFMNSLADVDEKNLDLLITSQGGSAEAAESIVDYLRAKFENIRVIVPVAAKSAATMIALGADEIVLGKHSQLGPIDPQFSLQTPEGVRFAPAAEILQQFEQAKKDCAANPANLAAWTPILRTYSPGLLAQCETSRELAETMVRKWLERYMFAGLPDASAKAKSAAEWFADYKQFGSHGRRVGLADLAPLGIKATALEADQSLQDLVLSVHHAYSHVQCNSRDEDNRESPRPCVRDNKNIGCSSGWRASPRCAGARSYFARPPA